MILPGVARRGCLADLSELTKEIPGQIREIVREQGGKGDVSDLDPRRFLLPGPPRPGGKP